MNGPRTDGRRTANDRGEGAVAHLVVILLIGLIAGALVTTSVGGWIAGGIEYAICRVVNVGDRAACETPADRLLRPTCTSYLATDSYGGTVDVLIFRVGKDYSFARTTSIAPDGTKTVTIIAVKGDTAGVGTGAGVGVNWGNAFNFGADASVDAQARLGLGDGWQFTGPDAERQADAFEGQLREQYQIDAVKENAGPIGRLGGTIYEAAAGPDLPAPNIRRFEAEVDINGSLSAMAGFGPADPKGRHRRPDRHTDPRGPQPDNPRDTRGSDAVAPNARAWVGVDANEKAIMEVNERTGETSVTFSLRGEVNYWANAGLEGPQGRRQAAGAITLTRKDGKLTKVTFVQTHIVDGRATVVTTELPLRTDEQRRAVAQDLLDPAGGGPGGQALQLTWDDMAPTTDPGPEATPLRRLLYDQGRSSRVEYAYDQGDANYGASVKLGLKVGLNVAISDSTRSAIGAQYLGAPTSGGRRPYLRMPDCRG